MTYVSIWDVKYLKVFMLSGKRESANRLKVDFDILKVYIVT